MTSPPPPSRSGRRRAALALAAALACSPAQAPAQQAQPAAPETPPAAQIVGGTAPVGPGNTRPDPLTGALAVELIPDPAQARKPVVRPNLEGPELDLLRALARRGFAAGLSGVLYDNRDRGHSQLPLHRLPQINATHYAPVFAARGLDYGIAGPFRFPMPTLGNSSTALTQGPFRRSQARIAVAGQAAAARAFDLYASNHLYVYPEHRDHDPGTGDLFFANQPFFLVSQGSSGSDRPFLWAAALTLAVLRPDTFAALERTGLVAPTLQMLLRRNTGAARGAAGYLSGAAHPSAFDGAAIDLLGMMQQAAALAPDAIPPLVRLRVERDLAATPGIDYIDPTRPEAIFTTPAAIARAWRSLAWEREMVLSAADTVDPNGRALEFDWVLLRGDPGRVSIGHDPDDPARRRARIRIAWHDAAPVPGAPELGTNRVDIGVFARNGATVSAPAFLSVVFPVHQARVYAPGPDGRPRIAEVSYDGGDAYVDPTLWARADWRDAYRWDGPLAGITRRYGDGTETTLRQGVGGLVRVAPDGSRAPVAHVQELDAAGVPWLRDGRGAAGP